jgi:hypothetical protein
MAPICSMVSWGQCFSNCQRRRERDAVLAVDNGSGLFVGTNLKMQIDFLIVGTRGGTVLNMQVDRSGYWHGKGC